MQLTWSSLEYDLKLAAQLEILKPNDYKQSQV